MENEGVRAAAARNLVAALDTLLRGVGESVVTDTKENLVTPLATNNLVVAGRGLDPVVAPTTIDPVDFAGDEIIGVSEDDVICPEFDEPVMTLRSDGSPVPAPLLSGLADDRAGVVTALVVPAVVVFVVVALLATLRVSTVGVLAGVARARRRNRSAARSQGTRA